MKIKENVMNKFIPLSIPNFEGNEEKYVVDAIASTFVSTVGGYVSRMEKELAAEHLHFTFLWLMQE